MTDSLCCPSRSSINFRKRAQAVQAVDRLIAGGTVGANVDGRSLVPLIEGDAAPDWRTGALIEHHGPDTAADDPDAQTARNGNPTTYEALRTATYTYVEYANGALHAAITGLENCHTHDACWTAGHVSA